MCSHRTYDITIQFHTQKEGNQQGEEVQVLHNDGAKKQLRNKRTRGGSQIKVAYGKEGSGKGRDNEQQFGAM